jgi:Transposase, Mutator family
VTCQPSAIYGIHAQAGLEDAAQGLLVIIGATPEGKKELVGLTDGVRESAQSWHELLLDLKRRGLAMGPEVAVADGALGFWQAIEEWPQTRGQHCTVGANQSTEQAGAGTSMARRLCNPDAFKPVSVKVPRLTRGSTVPTVSRPGTQQTLEALQFRDTAASVGSPMTCRVEFSHMSVTQVT